MARILLVDDSPIVLRVVSDFLGSRNHEVETMEVPFGVLNKINMYNPDVVLLDLGLPGLKGETLLKLLRDRFRGNCRVILISGDAGKMAALQNEGLADGFFTKGGNLDDLERKIHVRAAGNA